MKYLVKVWAWRPLFSEVVIHADSEKEAVEKIKNFKEDEIEWQSNPEVYTRSDKDSGK